MSWWKKKETVSIDPFQALHGSLLPTETQKAEGRWKELVFRQLVIAMKTGDVAGEEAMTLAVFHRKWLSLFWREGMYSREAHLTLGNIYVADPRFGAFYDQRVGAGAARFLRDAIQIYVLRGGLALTSEKGIPLVEEQKTIEEMDSKLLSDKIIGLMKGASHED